MYPGYSDGIYIKEKLCTIINSNYKIYDLVNSLRNYYNYYLNIEKKKVINLLCKKSLCEDMYNEINKFIGNKENFINPWHDEYKNYIKKRLNFNQIKYFNSFFDVFWHQYNLITLSYLKLSFLLYSLLLLVLYLYLLLCNNF